MDLIKISFYLRDKFFPILLNIAKKGKKHELFLINDRPQIDNAIYAVSHYCCHDFQYASEIIGKRCWVLVGKQWFDIASLIGLFLNGIIWCDRNSNPHKKKAVKQINRLLSLGENVLIFPEGTWNMSYSLPILPLYWGIIDIAKHSKRPIIPLILEYDYFEKKCYAAFGKVIKIDVSDDKLKCINQLRDEMSSLKWKIWEEKPIQHRQDVHRRCGKKN